MAGPALADVEMSVKWATQFGTPETDFVGGLAVDAAGNIYVGGTTKGDLGGTNAGDSDIWVRKYRPDRSIAWTRQIGTARADGLTYLEISASGGLYLAGTTAGPLAQPDSLNENAYLARLDPATGKTIWHRQYGAPEGFRSTVGGSVAIGPGEEVYLVGSQKRIGASEVFVARFDGHIGQMAWASSFGAPDAFNHGGVAHADGVGVTVAGSTQGSYLRPVQGTSDIITVRMDADGQLLGGRQWGSHGSDYVQGGCGGADGMLYYTGSITEPDSSYSMGFLTNLAPNGTISLGVEVDGDKSDVIDDVCLDGHGGFYIIGSTYSSLEGTNAGYYDLFAAHVDAAGTVHPLLQWGTDRMDVARDIALGPDGTVYLAGYTHGSLWGTYQDDDPNLGGDAFLVALTPEPGSMALLAIGGLAVLRRPRGRR